MCNRDLENLKRWKQDEYLLPQRAEVLTPQGVEDMKLLARRLQSNFPELLLPSAGDITSANYKVFLFFFVFLARVDSSNLSNETDKCADQ